jgi:hypothetical protein
MLKTYYDRSPMGSVTKTPEGYLQFDAAATRSGIFIYHQPDGSVRRAYRAPSEVFKSDSMASFALKPIINNHEMGLTPKITADNVKQYQIGSIGENIRRDGTYMRITGIIMDKAGIQAVNDGRRGLSLAYDSEDIDEPGITEDGQEYDYRQTKIRGNHLAIVDRGRAGPVAVLNMDTADIEETGKKPESLFTQRSRLMKYNLDGVEIDAPESIVNALVKARTDLGTSQATVNTLTQDKATAKTSLDSVTAERDAAKSEVVKLKAIDTNKLIQDGVAARIALVESAVLVCDAADLKGKTDAEIRLLVIKKVFPEMNMDGKSADYVGAMFDAAIKSGDTEQRRSALAKQRRAATSMDKGDGEDVDDKDQKNANTMLQDAYKQPCSMSVKKS